jgi:hypothetical protein
LDLLYVPASCTLSESGTVDAGMAAYTYDDITETYTQLGCDDDTGPGLMPQLTLATLLEQQFMCNYGLMAVV